MQAQFQSEVEAETEPADEKPPGRGGDWRWQLNHRIRSLQELSILRPDLEISSAMSAAAARFPIAITPYYAGLIRKCNESDPVFRMAVPDAGELIESPDSVDDPLSEDEDMPVPGLVHRYADRALLLVTSVCPVYCRHCTRKRVTGKAETCITTERLHAALDYIRANPSIHDVIVSGGDPLTLSTAFLENIISKLRNIPHIDLIRIGTRTPVTLPMRITPELVAMLKKYQPVWINTHFNHAAELSSQAIEACHQIVDAGIPLGNQSVLLRGVNDNPETMIELVRALVKNRIRPYYLFQCDLVYGVEHFRTPLSRGVEIMEALRGRVSGFAIPLFVVDLPGGAGKVPVAPDYIVGSNDKCTVFRSFEGKISSYPEPLLDMGNV